MVASRCLTSIAEADLIDLIETGQGTRESPFRLPAMEGRIAALSILRNIDRWEASHGLSWRIIDWRSVNESGPSHQVVRILRRRFTDDVVHDDRIAFTFDLSDVESPIVPHCSPLVWQIDDDLGFHHDIGWLHFDKMICNAPAGEPLDVSLLYNGVIGGAGLYVYGSCEDCDDGVLEVEAQQAIKHALTMADQPNTPWPAERVGPFFGQAFLTKDDCSFVGVTACKGRFVKLRLTMLDRDRQCREMFGECLRLCGLMLSGRTEYWITRSD